MMLLEQFQIVEGFPAVDLSAAANTGDYVSLKDYKRVVVVFHAEPGTAGDDPTLTIQQAKDNTGTDVKALNFTTIYTKQAATNLASTGQWTKVTQTAANTYTNTTSAEEDLIWAVEFKADELDVDNGFDHIRATVADVGTNAQLGVLFYVLGEPRDQRAVENLPSAL